MVYFHNKISNHWVIYSYFGSIRYNRPVALSLFCDNIKDWTIKLKFTWAYTWYNPGVIIFRYVDEYREIFPLLLFTFQCPTGRSRIQQEKKSSLVTAIHSLSKRTQSGLDDKYQCYFSLSDFSCVQVFYQKCLRRWTRRRWPVLPVLVTIPFEFCPLHASHAWKS